MAANAQQTMIYKQYVFGRSLVNPAAAGYNINQEVYYTFGMSKQWWDLGNSPKQTFGNFSYTIRPKRSYSYWQSIGSTIEMDQNGIFTNYGIYINYSIHLLLKKNLVLSFGTNAGFRKFSLTQGIIDPADPVLQNNSSYLYAYPDIIPGMRISNKKFFFDLSMRQITIQKQKSILSAGQIGGPSKLAPTIIAGFGVVVPISDSWIMLPSLVTNMAIINIPAIDPSVMFYYCNRFGVGVSSRNLGLLSAILQVRLVENLSIGMCYSYTLNRMRNGSANSFELMLGVAPMGLTFKQKGKRSVAKCPALDF